MIIEIKAKFSCDDCGTQFTVPVDPAYTPPAKWSIFDVAVDAVRGGMYYEDNYKGEDPGTCGSVEDGRHYCAQCTRQRDRAWAIQELEQQERRKGLLGETG